MTLILNPVAAPHTDGAAPLPLIGDLAGRTVGILTNHWQSMDRMAARMQEQLKTVYRAAGVRLHDVPINGAMSEAVRAAVIADCDAAIVGLAN